MPRRRAGRIVRCPECKSAIRIPKLTESQLSMGRTIPCRAKIARRLKGAPAEAAQPEQEHESKPLQQDLEQQREREQVAAENSNAVVDSNAVAEEQSRQVIPPPLPEEYLDLPGPALPEPPKPTRLDSVGSGVVASQSAADDLSASFISLTAPAETQEEEKDWEERLSVANQDRKIFAKFFAICLCLIAVLNVIPASLQWYHWTQLSDSVPLPRWIYIQLFIGSLYLIYAFFLAQIPDWSALRAVSVAMLLMAFIFGIISTGLLVGGHGDFSGFLGIPFALNRQACIWSVAMLCVATLMSFWGGKESANWRRAEQILENICSRSV